jgi:hypothetical protein
LSKSLLGSEFPESGPFSGLTVASRAVRTVSAVSPNTGSKYEPHKALSCGRPLDEKMTTSTQIRMAWLCWLVAVMLFFSG